MPLYTFTCDCGLTEDVSLPMSTPDLSKHPCQCGKVAKRVYHVPKLHLFGGMGDRFRLPETQAEEQALLLKKQKDEETAKAPDAHEWEWVPGKGVPERLQPKL